VADIDVGGIEKIDRSGPCAVQSIRFDLDAKPGDGIAEAHDEGIGLTAGIGEEMFAGQEIAGKVGAFVMPRQNALRRSNADHKPVGRAFIRGRNQRAGRTENSPVDGRAVVIGRFKRRA
jgi:hypothetical protein